MKKRSTTTPCIRTRMLALGLTAAIGLGVAGPAAPAWADDESRDPVVQVAETDTFVDASPQQVWELFLSDPDKDGYSTGAELYAGSDPFDASSVPIVGYVDPATGHLVDRVSPELLLEHLQKFQPIAGAPSLESTITDPFGKPVVTSGTGTSLDAMLKLFGVTYTLPTGDGKTGVLIDPLSLMPISPKQAAGSTVPPPPIDGGRPGSMKSSDSEGGSGTDGVKSGSEHRPDPGVATPDMPFADHPEYYGAALPDYDEQNKKQPKKEEKSTWEKFKDSLNFTDSKPKETEKPKSDSNKPLKQYCNKGDKGCEYTDPDADTGTSGPFTAKTPPANPQCRTDGCPTVEPIQVTPEELEAIRHPWSDVALTDPDAPVVDLTTPINIPPGVTNPGNVDRCHWEECGPIEGPDQPLDPNGDGV